MARFTLTRLFAAGFLLAVIAAACGTSVDNSEMARVGDRVLTRTQFDALLPDGDATVPARRNSVVTTWLVAQAVEFELNDRGYQVEESDLLQATQIVTASGTTIEDFQAELLRDTFALSLAVGRWTEKEMADRDPIDPPLYLCSNHILFETDDEAGADEALARALDGEDFADLAEELSLDPTAEAGGDLGCLVEGSLVPEFEEAAYAADAGDIIGPVMTDFGWHIIEIESVGPATAEVHPDADPQQIETIVKDYREIQINAVIFDLEQKARDNFGDRVVLDSSLGTFDAATFEIEPPE